MENSALPPSTWLDTRLARWFSPNLETLLAGLILLAAILSRAYQLGARSMSHDEINHVVPSYDYAQGLGYCYDPISHGPLQFHLIALSYFLFGDSDGTSRLPAALFGVAAVAAALFTFRPYLGKAGALAAGLLITISPTLLFYSRYARNEAFTVVWGLLSLYFILRYLERGELAVLVGFSIVTALHFTDKATAYIYAGEQVLFLFAYLIYRLHQRNWERPRLRSRCWQVALAGLVLLGMTAAAALIEKQAGGLGWATAVSATAAGIAMLSAGFCLLQGAGWRAIRAARAFDLLVLLFCLVLPLTGAVWARLAGLDPLNVGPLGLLRLSVILTVLLVLACGLGAWWKAKIWWVCAGCFFGIYIFFYSSIFSQPEGLVTGLFGGLSYWIDQQAVQRGDQPLYYYVLLQIPVYEFLPAIGALAAAAIAWRKCLWQSNPQQPFASPTEPQVAIADTAASPEPTLPLELTGGQSLPVPTMALLVYWSAANLVLFSIAGERMPWLTVNMALPLILTAAWGFSWLIDTLGKKPLALSWTTLLKSTLLAAFAFLAILTFRTAWRAAFILYDQPLEYLVYAHSAPDPKFLLPEIEEISRKTAGGEDLVIAYDNLVRYPYWWYLRHFPNRIDFGDQPTNRLRDAGVIVAGEGSYIKLDPILRGNYLEYDYNRMWWPNMDYWGLKWSQIDEERRAELAANHVAAILPLTFAEYLTRAWDKVWNIASSPAWRNAIWQIWFYRNYQPYALLKNSSSFDLVHWSPAERMRMYVRKDVAARVWGYSLPAQALSADPYEKARLTLSPAHSIGSAGSSPLQFQAPRGLAAAPDGSLYVADARNHRIQHLAPDGTYLGAWGSYANVAVGLAPGGTFNEPWGVAVGPEGAVYVADTWNHRVQKFSPTGQLIKMWGTFGQGEQPDHFYGPRGIAVDAQGDVLVVDTGNKRVVVFDSDGNFLSQFGSGGAGSGQMDEPVGIAIGPDGMIYLADTWNQRIQVYNLDTATRQAAMQTTWQVDAWYGQSLENKPFLAVDARGEIYASDPESCRVLEFSARGEIVHVWGDCAANGTLSGLAAMDGRLWVSDASSQRLLVFSPP